jgi:CRISPR system Cascade subunit CasC
MMMLIEIHIIQNHSPANLNRDDLGAPKTCIFGGAIRARISSQCLKRSIRRSPEFTTALEKDGGVRTRSLIREIARRAHGNGEPPEDLLGSIRKVFENGGVTFKKATESDPNKMDIIWFVPNSSINTMAAAAKNAENLANEIAQILSQKPLVPDIALSGRMTEFDAKGPFANLDSFRVEAALSAAHAISTHEVINEVDYFTAVDDRASGAAAAFLEEAMFNSACFYKHFVIDFEQLVKNLGNDTKLASTTVKCFLDAAAKANPSGKQHAFAAFNLPDGVLVEVKTKSATPVSYANAFADPVPEKSERGLIGESIARLGQYAHDLVVGYGIEAERFWFSPNLRHRLTWIDKSMKEHEQEQSVVGSDEFGEFDQFVHKVLDKMGAIGTPAEAAK